MGEGPPDASQDTEADGEEHDLSEAEIEQVTVRDEGPAEDVEEEGGDRAEQPRLPEHLPGRVDAIPRSPPGVQRDSAILFAGVRARSDRLLEPHDQTQHPRERGDEQDAGLAEAQAEQPQEEHDRQDLDEDPAHHEALQEPLTRTRKAAARHLRTSVKI